MSQGPSTVRGYLLRQLVYLHTISAAVQLCPDGDPKAIRLLSEGFLAGVKGVSYAMGCHPRGDRIRFTLACNTLGLVTLDAATLEAIRLLFNGYSKN